MATSSHQQGNGHLKYISNSPYIFKTILLDTILNEKLSSFTGIPRKFVKNHGNGMSSPALLQVPSGEVWKVELTKSDGKICFENSWLEFANHYSLELGHLLVFRYDRNSNFHIQYPYTSNYYRRSDEFPEQNINRSEDDDSIKIIGNISPSKKMREELQPPCPRPHKMMRSTNSDNETEAKCNEKSEFLTQQIRPNGCPARNDDSTSHPIIQQFKPHDMTENPCFQVVMHPSYVGHSSDKKCHTTNFVRKHLMKEQCSVLLCNSSGKTWIATFKQRRIGERLYIRSGWDTFVRDNNIQVGDFCAFELINSIEIYFIVVIHQGRHANSPSYASRSRTEPLTALEKTKAFRIASAFKSENPFFVVIIQPSNVKSCRLFVRIYRR
ncbi:hypothetical protein V6Z11_D03G020100 [Gossypium hirsutum]